VQFMLRIF